MSSLQHKYNDSSLSFCPHYTKNIKSSARDTDYSYTQYIIISLHLFTSCETQQFGPAFIFKQVFLQGNQLHFSVVLSVRLECLKMPEIVTSK